MRHLPALLAISAFALLGTVPHARAQTDATSMARHAAANQLGLLEFCQQRGDVGADAVSAETVIIGRLPPSSMATDSDESLGRAGTLAAPNGQKIGMADLAAQHGETVSALCKQLGSSATQSAAATANAGGMTMPNGMTMPAMPPMPAMPGGMTMPAMPGMPSASPGAKQ